jgi:hypothetical protein
VTSVLSLSTSVKTRVRPGPYHTLEKDASFQARTPTAVYVVIQHYILMTVMVVARLSEAEVG